MQFIGVELEYDRHLNRNSYSASSLFPTMHVSSQDRLSQVITNNEASIRLAFSRPARKMLMRGYPGVIPYLVLNFSASRLASAHLFFVLVILLELSFRSAPVFCTLNNNSQRMPLRSLLGLTHNDKCSDASQGYGSDYN